VRSRTIHPYQVAEFGIRTYVVAWAEDIGAWRRFRLDRIISATLTTTRFAARPDFTPMKSAADAFRPGPGVERVTVRFRREAAPWVTEFFAEHDVLADGSVLVQFDASSTEWLTRRVLEFGADAEVVEPRTTATRSVAPSPDESCIVLIGVSGFPPATFRTS
jgi:predicted DNA-binding transcriptional regulator YafY